MYKWHQRVENGRLSIGDLNFMLSIAKESEQELNTLQPSEIKIDKKLFILLHGAWHANWCWNRVTPLLEKQGHTVISPNLPGHGDDKIPFTDITLNSYVDSIIRIIESKKVPVVLVGHSMSGVVISQVAEKVPEKISHLVYVSAFIPDFEGSLIQEASQNKQSSMGKEMVISEKENEIALKLSPLIKSYFYNTCEEQDALWALSNLQKQPLRPFMDTVKLSSDRFGKIPKLYIECLRDQAIPIEEQRRMHGKLFCKVVSLDTDHSPFLSEPFKLAEMVSDGVVSDGVKS